MFAERTKLVDTALTDQEKPITTGDLAEHSSRAKEADVAQILETLAALGRARRTDDRRLVAVSAVYALMPAGRCWRTQPDGLINLAAI